MKLKMKRVLLAVLLMVVIGGVFSVTGYAEGGKCGDNVTWNLSGTVMTISGSGKMYDYDDVGTPWAWKERSVTRLVIEPGVTHIGNNAFYGFGMLFSASIPSTVTSIGNSAFSSCVNLVELKLPDGLKSIGNGCFFWCTWLEKINIPSGLTSIGSGAFQYTKLSSFTFPSKITEVPASCFAGCEALEKVTFAKNTTAIGDSAFKDCTKLASITIPSTVTKIGSFAFEGCTKLTAISIGKNVTEIGSSIFRRCTNLKSLSVSSDSTHFTVSNGLLFTKDKKELVAYTPAAGRTVSVPSGVEKIRDYCFAGAPVTSVTLPSSLTWIGAYSFSESKLKSITIPASVQTIDYGAFYYASQLAKVNLKSGKVEGSRYYGVFCFAYTAIEDLVIPEMICSIDGEAFAYCKDLKHVSLPAGLVLISDGAFSSDPSLASIDVAAGNPAVTLKNGFLISLNTAAALWVNPSLTGDVVIPSGVRAVTGGCSFYSAASVTFPASVEWVSQGTARTSAKLIFLGNAPQFSTDGYYYNLCSDTRTIYYDPSTSGWDIARWEIGMYESHTNVWKTIKALNFDANGGIGGPTGRTITSGTYTIGSAKPTRTGYTFLGWATSPNATKATYQPGDKVKLSGSKTFYAVWRLKTYTVKYSANGGSNAPSSQTKTYDIDMPLETGTPTRTGYNFQGWATSKTGSVKYQPGDTYTANSSQTLYAVWKAKTYTLSYDANGGSGAPSSQTKTYGKALTLRTGTPTRTGYIFQGWATSKTGSVKYQPGDSYTTNGTKTLYAVWKAKTYKLSYDANGGSDAPSSQTKTYGKTLTLRTGIPTRKGYTFLGWATSKDGSVKYQPGDSYTTNSTKTLYAKWKANHYTIKFNGNGKTSGTMSSLTDRKYGTTYTLPANAYKRTGYNFVGWNTKADGSGTQYDNEASVKSLSSKDGGSVTLYAQWAIKTYVITLEGSEDTPCLIKEYGQSVILPSEVTPPDGYIFVGWTDSEETVLYAPGSAYTKNASITLYPKWGQNRITICFDGNGADTGSMEPITDYSMSSAFCVPDCSFAKYGFAFAGWNTCPDNSGTSYLPSDTVSWPQELQDGDVFTLYAMWTLTSYTIHLDGNGADSGEMADWTECQYGHTLLPENQFVKEGYDFLHWGVGTECGPDCTEDAGLFVWNNGDAVTLYAHWALHE